MNFHNVMMNEKNVTHIVIDVIIRWNLVNISIFYLTTKNNLMHSAIFFKLPLN